MNGMYQQRIDYPSEIAVVPSGHPRLRKYLVLIELFRLLIIYLEEHRISVSTMVEVGIVSTLREVILKGALEIDWRQMLVLCAFILTLGLLLRYAGVRSEESGNDPLADQRAL